MYAKYLDNILTGVYTDVIPINTYILSENMKDIAEKVNSKWRIFWSRKSLDRVLGFFVP